jgi:hypothetical protein
MSDNRIGTGQTNDQSGLRVKIDQSRSRQTANTSFGHVMSEGMTRSADAVLQAGQLAAPFIPGGAVLSAAITGVGTLKSTASGNTVGGTAIGGNSTTLGGTGTAVAAGGSAYATGAGGTRLDALASTGNPSAVLMQESQKMQEMNMSFNMQYLMLQQKMQDESRRFTLLSNIMKTKHDTAKNSVGNIR